MTKKSTLYYFILALVIQIPFIFHGIDHFHSWRQSDTAAVARNFVVESPNIFKPRIDIRNQGITGITSMEFPLYQYTVSLFFRILQSDHDAIGLATSFLSMFLSFLALTRLLPHFNPNHLFIIFFSIPIVFTWSHKFMPETMALALSLWGMVYHHKNNTILSTIFFTLGSLTRPFFIFFNLPVLWRFISSLFQGKLCFRSLISGVTTIIFFYLWYFYWCPILRDTYGIRYFSEGYFSFSNYVYYFNLDMYKKIGETLLFQYINPSLLIFTILGILGLKKTRLDLISKQLLFISFITIFLQVPLILNHFFKHPYYYFPVVTAGTLLALIGLESLKKNRFALFIAGLPLALICYKLFISVPSKSALISFTLPVFLYLSILITEEITKRTSFHLDQNKVLTPMLIFVIIAGYFLSPFIPEDDITRHAKSAVKEVQEKTKPEDLFIINAPLHSVTMYTIRRKGFIDKTEKIQRFMNGETDVLKEYIDQGAKWILLYSGQGFTLHKISSILYQREDGHNQK